MRRNVACQSFVTGDDMQPFSIDLQTILMSAFGSIVTAFGCYVAISADLANLQARMQNQEDLSKENRDRLNSIFQLRSRNTTPGALSK